ncbi:MAG: hypothetical protein WC271_00465 [Bacteroidales bacterium]
MKQKIWLTFFKKKSEGRWAKGARRGSKGAETIFEYRTAEYRILNNACPELVSTSSTTVVEGK